MNINLGGGDWVFPFFRNVDYYAKEEFIDYKVNLEENPSLPFKDNSVDLIYSSHMLEHLSHDSLVELLNECYRVLKGNGMMRLNCPINELHLFYVGCDHGVDILSLHSILLSCGFGRICPMRFRHSHKPVFALPFVFDNNRDLSIQFDVFKEMP